MAKITVTVERRGGRLFYAQCQIAGINYRSLQHGSFTNAIQGLNETVNTHSGIKIMEEDLTINLVHIPINELTKRRWGKSNQVLPVSQLEK